MNLTVGQIAPQFSLPDHDGNIHKLSDYAGQCVLLYFYPKDNTPGCIVEACLLRDNWTEFAKHNTVVLGVSTDPVASHQKFAQKFKLPFPILADIEKEVVERYGVWGEKSFMGKKYKGTNRTSFLIDPNGKIVKIYEKVKPQDHANQVLADLEAILI